MFAVNLILGFAAVLVIPIGRNFFRTTSGAVQKRRCQETGGRTTF